jgi:hypothetical protein
MSGRKDYDKDAKQPSNPTEDKAAQDAAKEAFKQVKQDQIRDKGKDK